MGCLARAANATRDPRVLALMEEISSRVGNCIALHCIPWSGEPSNSNNMVALPIHIALRRRASRMSTCF